MPEVTTASNSPQFLETVATRRRLKPYTPVAPLAVPPLEAARLLSAGLSHIYGLLGSGELQAFSSGRSRRSRMDSIGAYMARQLPKADAKACDPAKPAPARRRRKARERA